jgi:K+-transporting ATPase ATPase B chain
VQWRNPVMFVVYIGSILTTLLWLQALQGQGEAPTGFILAITLWLWFTVLFANFAEALAEGRSKAQAASLRGLKKEHLGQETAGPEYGAPGTPVVPEQAEQPAQRRRGAGRGRRHDPAGRRSHRRRGLGGRKRHHRRIAPVIRESGGDFSAVTGGTRVLSDWLVVRITVNPGETFLDRMIAMVEGAKRQKTPNEIALTILLVALTIVFLVRHRHAAAVFALQRGRQQGRHAGHASPC